MPDTLKLDFDTERRLTDYIQQDIAHGRFNLSHDQLFVLDPHGDPGRADLAREMRERFSFIDFEAGGLKVLDLKIRGADARFTIVPRVELPQGGKGRLGASIGLRFTISW
ncbi:MAG: hypothetical protein IT373_17320 [Polyangiaceae bacterium]|nr:hypothetical protein [Polyangiaceae bacterium]